MPRTRSDFQPGNVCRSEKDSLRFLEISLDAYLFRARYTCLINPKRIFPDWFLFSATRNFPSLNSLSGSRSRLSSKLFLEGSSPCGSHGLDFVPDDLLHCPGSASDHPLRSANWLQPSATFLQPMFCNRKRNLTVKSGSIMPIRHVVTSGPKNAPIPSPLFRCPFLRSCCQWAGGLREPRALARHQHF
jgi:hypothetical protein